MRTSEASTAVRVGILGAGNVVREWHLPVLSNISNVKVEWICDTSRSAARRAVSAFCPWAAVHERIDDCSAVDIVLVAIPVGHRRDPLLRIFERGWSALCEKPFAVGSAEHRKYLESALAARVHVGVGFMRRYYRPTIAAQHLIRSGALGKLRGIWASQGTKTVRTGREDWYQTDRAAAGGGVLMETGSHIVDQVFAILDVQSFELCEVQQEFFNELDTEDKIVAHISTPHQSEIPFHLTLSNERDLALGIVFQFDSATVNVGTLPQNPVRLSSKNTGRSPITLEVADGAITASQAFYLEWIDFINECTSTDGYKSEISAQKAISTTEFIEECYGFHRQRRSELQTRQS